MALDPPVNPPPYIQTITGSFAPEEAPEGRHRLMNRQSSDDVGDIETAPGRNAACAQSEPNLVASRTLCHGDKG